MDPRYVQQYIQMQEQSNKQLQKDSFLLIDIIHRTISSAEKYAMGNHRDKKYGFWDENDTANLRNEDDLQFEFLMKIQTVIGGLKEFNKRYPKTPIPFYDEIPKEDIIKDLKNYQKIVLQDKKKYHNAKLYDQLIDILNGGKYNIMSKQELMKNIDQNLRPSEQDIREMATEIFGQNVYSSQGVRDASNYIDKNNKYYQPGELGVEPGRGYHHIFNNK